jgi:tRNA(Ile)-lysidine synthase
MPWSGPSPADPRITLIRPLLGVDRASIARYARDHRIRFREDRSNDDTRILRNRIRHCLVPLLARDFQPAFSTVILRTMEILRAESEVVEKLARRHASRKGRRGFDKLPLALKRRIVVNELLRLGLATPFDLVDQLIREPARPVQVSPKVRLRLLADGALRKIKSKSGDFDLAEQFIPLNGKSGTARFGQVDFRWRIRTGPPAVEIPGAAARPGHEWFDAAALGRGIRLRHWRPGDRFQPIGAGSPRKLQDLFVNLKVSKALRHQRIVAEGFDGTLFWVEGMRIGDSAKVTSKTARYLHWEWRCAKGP